MRELYHINRLLTAGEHTTRSGDWHIGDTVVNHHPSHSFDDAVESDDLDDESTAHVQAVPTYWAEMNKEMKECNDNYQLARILAWLSCRFAFMEVAVECSTSMADFTLQELDQETFYVPAASRRKLNSVMDDADCLKDRIRLLQSNLKHVALFGAIKPRMQAQQTMASCLN